MWRNKLEEKYQVSHLFFSSLLIKTYFLHHSFVDSSHKLKGFKLKLYSLKLNLLSSCLKFENSAFILYLYIQN